MEILYNEFLGDTEFQIRSQYYEDMPQKLALTWIV